MQDQYGNYVVQRMIETTEAAMLRELHLIMLQFITDITPSINEKMHRNLDINLQKPDVMQLARAYFQQSEKAGLWGDMMHCFVVQSEFRFSSYT